MILPPDLNTAAAENRTPWRQRVFGGFKYRARTFALIWEVSPVRVVVIVLLQMLGASQSVAMAWVGKKIVDSVVQALSGGAHPEAAKRHVILWLFVELVLMASAQGCNQLNGWLRRILEAKLRIHISLSIMQKALLIEYYHFEDPAFNDRLARARCDSSSRPMSVVQGHLQLARNMLTVFGYGVLLFHYSPWAAVGVLVAVIPSVVLEAHVSRKLFELRKRLSSEKRQLGYIESVASTSRYVKETKLFRLGNILVDRYRIKLDTSEREELQLVSASALQRFCAFLFSLIIFYAYYFDVALRTAAGRITLGDMTLYLAAFRQCQTLMQSSLLAVNGLYEDSLYLSNLFEFLDMPVQQATSPTHLEPRAELGIRFESVGFRYPGSDKWVMRDFSVFIAKGTSLALVGDNGAGKTTLIKLLCRLYDPTEGRILIDGRDLKSYQMPELWRRTSIILQDFNHYEFSVRDNVAFGDVEHLSHDGKIRRALTHGGADDIVASFPEGLNAQLGRTFAPGYQLSGGQWQKVALSRAFMNDSADILILDEPTAALDIVAESAVFQRFRALTKGRTTFFISHRFATVRMANRILVLENGRLIEDGSHDELVSAGGKYGQMFELQAKGYR